jgi:signal transduction histidine kinase
MRIKVQVRSGVLLCLLAGTLGAGVGKPFLAAAEHPGRPAHVVTNVVQFRGLSGQEFLKGCAFELSGVVTLVDTNYHRVVLQDRTDAVALHLAAELQLAVGEMVSVAASNCYPMDARFADYPHRPSGWDVRRKFEAPMNWGQYFLTRMRGWLQPPVSGHYTFSIASDNSSELWLSPDADPANTKKIAFLPRYAWVGPREWSKLASQRSESIWLNAGQSYYIEALQEQTVGEDNLAIAWQGPNMTQSVIPGSHLTPWSHGRYADLVGTNGILREYWTNFTTGDVAGLHGPRPFKSVLRVEQLHVLRREPGALPKPVLVSFNPRWMTANNYRWVEAAGVVTFVGENGNNAFLELADSKAQVQLRTVPGQPALSRLTRNLPVRVHGVCEGVFDETGTWVPGWIWIAATNGLSVIETAQRDAPRLSATHALTNANRPAQPLSGFYGTRGLVTFSDRVFGKDCLFVQEGSAAIFVSLKECQPMNQLQVGQWVDLGGTLEAGKSLPTMAPMVIKVLGWRSMPAPVTDAIQFPIPRDRDGKWTEVEGIVRSVQSNGTLSVMGSKGPVSVWIGGASHEPGRFVDAKLRVRGVLSLSVLEHPVLLVPSRSFVEVAEPAPANPFAIPVRAIADLACETGDPSSLHRVRLMGQVTLRDAESFFLQEATGGARVQTFGKSEVNVGDSVEVIGFPSAGEVRTLANALVRTATGTHRVEPANLDLTDPLHVRQNGVLVRVEADLLGQRKVGHNHLLELRERQRIFTATLPASHGALAAMVRGSRIGITGVCDSESSARPAGMTAEETAALGSLNIWLRTPVDVKVLSGPPWWTWQRTAALIGTLLAVLSGALLWIHLLRRRLERQKAAQLTASQQILKRLEDERRRIAANLHDSLGQILLAIKNQTLLAMQRAPDETLLRERLGEISGATSQALEEVRQITHGLRPYQLDRLGLTQAMRATVDRASANSAILFASRVEDVDGVFDNDSEIHVYRIVQEAINNVLKHSGATEAAVVIKKRKNDELIHSVSISVRDNGGGFEVADMRASQSNALGYGLSGIAERARILGGRLTIDSRPARGTSLTIEIPIHHHAAACLHTHRG